MKHPVLFFGGCIYACEVESDAVEERKRSPSSHLSLSLFPCNFPVILPRSRQALPPSPPPTFFFQPSAKAQNKSNGKRRRGEGEMGEGTYTELVFALRSLLQSDSVSPNSVKRRLFVESLLSWQSESEGGVLSLSGYQRFYYNKVKWGNSKVCAYTSTVVHMSFSDSPPLFMTKLLAIPVELAFPDGYIQTKDQFSHSFSLSLSLSLSQIAIVGRSEKWR